MFSPESSTLDRAAALRGSGSSSIHGSNPRRRQRTASSDSLAVRQTQAKRRKRSALAETVFDASTATPDQQAEGEKSQQHYQHANGSATIRKRSSKATNGYANGAGDSAGARHRLSNGATTDVTVTHMSPAALADTSIDAGSLAVRSKGGRKDKRSRNSVEDGIELTKTDNYILTRDRGIPAALQEVLGSEPWHASLHPELGFAVATTHTRAIVWKYGHSRLHNYDAGHYNIQLPPHSGTGYEALPIGSLVHDAGAGGLALLVALPGGKTAYYESVRAAANGERQTGQTSNVLTGSLSGAFSSEVVSQISEAESDGFLLATNMGRLFHLSVRDSQGRPSISTQLLRIPTSEKVGLFGSLRKAITGGTYDEIASIVTLPSRSRSSKDVIVTTAKGIAHLWNITRHGAKTVEKKWNFGQMIQQACHDAFPSLDLQNPTLLDLSLMPASRRAATGERQLMALVSFSELTPSKFFLVGYTIHNEYEEVEHVHQIHTYNGEKTTGGHSGKGSRPTLLIPEPGHTAFVMFETKIVLVSLAKLRKSPDSQLHIEAHDLAENYEECLYFSKKIPYNTAGCAIQLDEDRGDTAATCDIMIHGFGQVRLTALAMPAGQDKAERQMNLVKSRLEQVVFYGAMNDNFLDFQEEGLWTSVTVDDVQAASSRIIAGILDSTSPHVPSLMPSMEQQLKLRSQAILDLNKFVQRWALLSRRTCWELLWAGEKLAAARAIFSTYNAEITARTDPNQKILLDELVEMIHEDYRHLNEPERGEHDPVRHWLINDVGRFSFLLSWAQKSIDQLVEEGAEAVDELAPLVAQAADISIIALETAWKFREDHAETFGLGRDVIENGIYQGSYADMPSEPWNATEVICRRTGMLFVIIKSMALQLDTVDISQMPFGDELIKKLVEQAAQITDCTFRCWEEQCRWVETSEDTAVQTLAKSRRARYKAVRHEILNDLVDMSAHVPAAALAEKYLDMEALAAVVSKIEMQGGEWSYELDPDLAQQGTTILTELKERKDVYFDLYGRGWARAFYDQQIETGMAAGMLDIFCPKRQDFLTEYLRSKKSEDKSFYKLAWINEVRGEGNFAEAAMDLWTGQRSEQRLWAKQVGLAMTKLGKFAALEKGQIGEQETKRDIRVCTQRIKFTEVQQRLYEYIRPLLQGAIDGDAEMQLAMDGLGSYVKGRPTLEDNLRSTIQQLVTRRVIGIEEMIETLTLISSTDQVVDDEGFADDRFYWALWLLHTSKLEVNLPERAILQQRLIWRRAILQDDWVALNKTDSKSDEVVMEQIRGTALYKTLRAGYEDGLLDKHPPYDPLSLHPAGETVAQLREVGMHPKQDDAYLARLAKDLTAEDAELEEAVSKGRLDMWWKGIIEGARAEVRGDRDAHAKLREFKEQESRAIKEELSQRMMRYESSAGSDSQSQEALLLNDTAETENPIHENGSASDDKHIVETNGNGIAHTRNNEEDVVLSNQIIEETEKNNKTNAVPKKTAAKKGVKKATTKSRKQDAEGDVVMAS